MPIDIDLWLWPLDRTADEVRAFSARLSPAERARRDRFVKPRDAARFAVGRGRLREILASYLGGAPEAVALGFTDRGKPHLPDGPSFNLSHAEGWAALAVGPSGLELGVDIEAFRPVEPAVAARFFAPGEVAELAALPQAQWEAGFFRCWTRKEAAVKATGMGLGGDLTSFHMALTPGEACRMRASTGDLGDAADWALVHLDLSPRFVGAVAARTGGDGLRLSLREGRLPLA